MVDIEDGWGAGTGRVAASPLRHAAARRATSPGFAGGGQGQSNTHRLMGSSCAERGVC